ncbi:hypothetical protein ACFOYW_00545 [Gryllotalpicola reticulitermitis]|uniref:Integral membrane protein n=1 Tax=Gryllotalpicola reticulitermitis TaxID=1184153 RepID=A0ABV8Q377_9MICO
MSRQLSAEFRRWSRWYPSSWRADSGAAMLGTYLDVADAEGRDRLASRDKAALVAGGIASRMDLVVPSRVRDGVAAVMLPLLGIYGLVIGLVFEWAPWAASTRAHWFARVSADFGGSVRFTFGPFLTPMVIVAAFAVLAWITCMFGPAWLYRSVLAATVVAGLVVTWMAHFGVGGFQELRATPPLFAALLALLALPGARPRRGYVLLGSVLWEAALFLASHVSGAWTLHDFADGTSTTTDSLFFMVIIGPPVAWIAAVLGLVAALVLAVARRRSLAAIIVLCTLPWAAYAPGPEVGSESPLMWAPLALGYLAAAVIAIVAMRVSRRRITRRVPDLPIGG